jgi:hypothetical protein
MDAPGIGHEIHGNVKPLLPFPEYPCVYCIIPFCTVCFIRKIIKLEVPHEKAEELKCTTWDSLFLSVKFEIIEF